MKLQVTIFCVCLSFFTAMSVSLEGWKELQASDIETLYINQRLDHFNAIDKTVWKQRYLQKMTYYKEGGPMFLLIGGEWNVESHAFEIGNGGGQLYGQLEKWLKEYHAGIIYLEHRYYGESIPRVHETLEDYSWLSSRQALNDIAEFIQQMNQARNITGPWISFGCSYGGSLATWLRTKFPHLIHGSIADSAPVLAANVNLPRLTAKLEDEDPWFYQVCSEFGWRFWYLDLPTECQKLGEIFTTEYMQELRNDTNIYYGAKEIDVDNVVSLTASKDKWTPFAITEDINDNSPAYTIKNGIHCDAYNPTRTKGDPDSVKKAVNIVEQNIKKWIKNA